jgi:hypothetical protein
MSDTPRTDAAEFDFSEDCAPQDNMVVASCDMRKLERELNEANAQLRSLKLELKESYNLKNSLVKGHLELGETLKEANADRLRLREAVRLMYDASPVTYVYACDKARALINSPPPPVVAKADADALASALEMVQAILDAETEGGLADAEEFANAIQPPLKTYRNKYKEGKQ